jgi:NADH dehydrogenase/NADH:ubiquinone oxidoreductase subunit G
MNAFAHKRFSDAELDEAIKLCRLGVAAVVVVGAGIDRAAARKLGELRGKAKFLPLFPATNGYRAKELGLENAFGADGADVLYLLVGNATLGDEIVGKANNGKFVVAHAAYLGPATDIADIVLPAPVWYERSGTFTNLAGQKAVVSGAVPMSEGMMSEDKVLAELAARL